MIGIVICTHSTLAQGLKDACEMIAGEQEQFEAICFMGDDDLLDLSTKLQTLGTTYPDGCIYITDLMGATPFNASLLAITNTNNVVLAGASLPMVLELIIKRPYFEGTCKELAQEIMQSSCDYTTMKCADDVMMDDDEL